MEQRLHCQEALVVARKNELLITIQQQYYVYLLGMLILAFIVGWKIGKDFNISQIAKTGLMFYLNVH